MSGAMWIVVATFATSVVLALLGWTIYHIDSNRFNKNYPPPGEHTLRNLGIAYVGDLVVYAVLLLVVFRMGAASMPSPLLMLLSIPVAGFGILPITVPWVLKS